MSQKFEAAAPGTALHGPRYRIGPSSGATPSRGDHTADALHPDSLAPDAGVRRLDSDRDLRALVLFLREPVFAMAPGRTEDFHFIGRRNGQPVRVTVSSDDSGGGSQATVVDADALIPVISELTALRNEGRPLPRTLVLRPAVALHALGRSGGGRQRRLLDDAFVRLAATTIIHTDATGTRLFRPIEVYEQLPGGARRLTLPAELVAEVEAGHVLKLDPDALRLKGLERRLYSLARAHTGRDGTWRVGFDLLVRLCPWRGTWRKFRSRLAAVAAAQGLPGFVLTVADLNGCPALSVTRAPTALQSSQSDTPAADAAGLDDLEVFILEDPTPAATAPPPPPTVIDF